MSANQYATCHGCGRPHHLTAAGTFRLHRVRGATCPGAGQRPHGPVTTRQATLQPPTTPRHQPPPDEPADGRSCDGGNCNAPSIGWRWYRDLREWLPVCGIHMAGPAGPTRHYDPPADAGEA